ncbi:MAG: dihydrofolate reductase [Dermatophilaceae bacterium]
MSATDPAPAVGMIAAVARNGVIGDGSGMPWHLPEDLAFFKRTTLGGTLIMGRGTFDSIGRALPGRHTIVLTRDPEWHAPGVTTAPSLDAALHAAEEFGAPIWIAGGGQIYRLAMPQATHLVITEVDQDAAGSVTFPPIDPDQWVEVDRMAGDSCAWVTYRRRLPARAHQSGGQASGHAS